MHACGYPPSRGEHVQVVSACACACPPVRLKRARFCRCTCACAYACLSCRLESIVLLFLSASRRQQMASDNAVGMATRRCPSRIERVKDGGEGSGGRGYR